MTETPGMVESIGVAVGLLGFLGAVWVYVTGWRPWGDK